MDQITTIFNQAKKIKPTQKWQTQTRIWLLEKVEEQNNTFSPIDLLLGQLVKHKSFVLAIFIFLVFGATTVIALLLLNNFEPSSDNFLGLSAKWLADEWKNIEGMLNCP